MNILLTNDDGYRADGIRILSDVLISEGHTVYVVAPSENRSAVSNGITMTRPLELYSVGDRSWSCSGTPADCVITALKSNLIDSSVDIILSGINDGGNIGTDIIYSGTCAAARQGALYGIPSVALSIAFSRADSEKQLYYRRMAKFAEKNLEVLLRLGGADRCAAFVNVNAFDCGEWGGARTTRALSVRQYDDVVDVVCTESGCMKAYFYGKEPVSSCCEDSDFRICSDGFIAVSRILVEPVHLNIMDGIRFSL